MANCAKLKEYADANKYTVQYCNARSQGPAHNPFFTIDVTVQGGSLSSVCTGTGVTKKRAKDNAAREMITILERDEEPEKRSVFRENVIGELQELCQKNGWPLPEYSDRSLNEVHILICHIRSKPWTFTVYGTGPSNKCAKTDAAKRALDILTACIRAYGKNASDCLV